MNILCTTDWHLRESNPRFRKDDFTTTQFNKLVTELELAKSYNALMINAGDMFDSAKISIRLLLKYYCLLKAGGVPIYSVPGQHDLRYHNKKEYENTPVCALEKTDCIKVLNKTPTIINDNIHLYGCWWEGKIPKIKNRKVFNVLVIHKMITDGGPEWYGQEDYTPAKKLLSKTGFDLIISGDNHRPFVIKYKKQTLINPGTMVRQKRNELSFKPRVYLFNTKTREIKKIYIPIEPAKKVFDLAGIENEEQRKTNISLREFVDSINVQVENKPNFIKVLAKVIKKAKPKKGVLKKIDMFMEKANEGY